MVSASPVLSSAVLSAKTDKLAITARTNSGQFYLISVHVRGRQKASMQMVYALNAKLLGASSALVASSHQPPAFNAWMKGLL